MNYSICVFYPAEHYPRLDRAIEKILKKESDGSGMGFGERDLAFTYKALPAAFRAFQKLNKIRTVNRVLLEKDRAND